jgi:hypothetical protein
VICDGWVLTDLECESTRLAGSRIAHRMETNKGVRGLMSSSVLDAKTGEEVASHRSIRTAVFVLCFVSMIFSLCAIFVGFHQNLFSFHSFRQTQTALSTETMLHGGALLRYELPVLGPPWQVPFEFPLYQWTVAAAVKVLGSPLEETGRAISIVFFYLCFLPLASILSRLRFNRMQVAAILGIFAVSPLYIFVSRLYMIESTALFLSLMYVEQVFRTAFRDSTWRFRSMLGAAVFGALGGAVKVTTFAPYYVLGVGLIAWRGWKLSRDGTVRWSRLGAAALLTGLIPFGATTLWTKFADQAKVHNPLSVLLTSESTKLWNFGTLQERLSFHNYALLLRYANDQIGYIVAGVLIAVAYALLFRRWNRIALVCVALYAGTGLLFFNLHINHEYYPYGDAVLLVVAIGVLIAPFLELPGWKAWAGIALLVVEMAACMSRYHRYYYRNQQASEPGFAALATAIDRTTRPDDVILITGLDWSPALPYQSRRRAIMDMGTGTLFGPKELALLEKSISMQGPRTIAAVVACGTQRDDIRLNALLQFVGIDGDRKLEADGCDVYQRDAQPAAQ